MNLTVGTKYPVSTGDRLAVTRRSCGPGGECNAYRGCQQAVKPVFTAMLSTLPPPAPDWYDFMRLELHKWKLQSLSSAGIVDRRPLDSGAFACPGGHRFRGRYDCYCIRINKVNRPRPLPVHNTRLAAAGIFGFGGRLTKELMLNMNII